MKKTKNIRSNWANPIALLFWAIISMQCKPDRKNDPVVISSNNSHTVYILNEGGYGNNNADLSVFDTLSKTILHKAYLSANGNSMGDVLQSAAIIKDNIYCVLNNSNKIEVVDKHTFVNRSTITGFSMPRFVVPNADTTKLYISEWVSLKSTKGNIKVIDVHTNTVTNTIQIGYRPEQMLLIGQKLYVCNSYTNTLTVIHTQSDLVIDTIRVGYGANSMVEDKYGNIWVLCGGIQFYGNTGLDLSKSHPPSLYKLNSIGTVTDSISLSTDKLADASRICIDKAKQNIYYLQEGSIYKHHISNTEASTTPFIAKGSDIYYGLAMDENDNIYTGTGTFSSDKFIRYNTLGIKIDEYTNDKANHIFIGVNGFLFDK